MSKERLEEIKEIDISPLCFYLNEMTNFDGKLLKGYWKWLIEQAERVQELEKQNKRYREALKKIKLNVKICGNEEYFPKVVEEIVNEALEGEE